MAYRRRGSEGEQFRKLFIGGITYDTTESDLREFYGQFGTIVDAVVMVQRGSNRSRGFGFVTFSEPNMVDKAQAARPHRIRAREVEAKRATPREDSSGPEAHQTINKLFVANIKRGINEQMLQDYFCQYGNIEKVEIIKNSSGEFRGFAFITYDDYDPVDKAILYRPHNVNGQKLDCRKAVSKEEMRYKDKPSRPPPSQGRYGHGPPPHHHRGSYGDYYSPGPGPDPYGPPPYGYGRDPYYDSYPRYDYGPPPRQPAQSWGYEAQGPSGYGEAPSVDYGYYDEPDWREGPPHSQGPTAPKVGGSRYEDPRTNRGPPSGPSGTGGPIRNHPNHQVHQEQNHYQRPIKSEGGPPYDRPIKQEQGPYNRPPMSSGSHGQPYGRPF